MLFYFIERFFLQSSNTSFTCDGLVTTEWFSCYWHWLVLQKRRLRSSQFHAKKNDFRAIDIDWFCGNEGYVHASPMLKAWWIRILWVMGYIHMIDSSYEICGCLGTNNSNWQFNWKWINKDMATHIMCTKLSLRYWRKN